MLVTSETQTVAALMAGIGGRAKQAARILALAPTAQKNDALIAIADILVADSAIILAANARDMARGSETGLSAASLDRLKLDEKRVTAMAESVRAIATLDDPVGTIISQWTRPNGLSIERVRTPLGVIGVIFESRPNVTADAGALCLKSGNASILRCGSDSRHSSDAIHAAIVKGLMKAGLPAHAIQLVPVNDRAAVGEMLSGLGGAIDVIVPRGGRSLVARVQTEARVPVFAHLEGLCHIYIDASAHLGMAKAVTLNAKMRRTGICGAVETLLVDRQAAGTHLIPVLETLSHAGCEIRGSSEVLAFHPLVKPASEADWASEYLDAIISVKLVEGIGGAIDHIAQWSSHHTEAVIAEDEKVVERFFNEVDSAILLHNASTQFADGGEFGFGGEIGIATGKMHARGPVGVEQLTSFNYRVRGTGQTRP
ncbi:glutamate-5-semialdehyde dehydrogenase [Limoniibacter endophyticus]|uniref:Gamma-glutamyl phosphate reductase n=1 Tax=Limoniibacter endophyticus TaxID=1565040 RepID=A0A8J3DI00_9HYPH|nr:glutamate-5-semialdehyde dehydrogenase [Limoniibacter endophyticus]GHC73767.1 gamma-glutamyl phosphate reductase [Limoniibacter endophyticus]